MCSTFISCLTFNVFNICKVQHLWCTWWTALDLWMTATVWSRCGKTEVIGMHWVGRWQFLHLILLLSQHWWGGGVPSGVAWQMSDPPLDPPSRFPSWEGWSSILHASSYAEEDNSLEPPSTEGWQFFQPWCQMASNIMDRQQKHFLDTRPSL